MRKDPEYLARISALPSGPAYADHNFGGDPEKGAFQRSSYAADSVVLTLEFLSDGATKLLTFLLRMSMISSFVLLIIQLWWKVANDASTLAYSDTILVVNVAVAIASVVLLLLAGGFYLYGIYKAKKEKKRWNARRKRYCILGGMNLLFQFLISVFYLAPNAYGLAQPCSWFLLNTQVLSYFRWTSFSALITMQILQALTLLPIDALPFYKGKVAVGLDLPSKVYFCIFFVGFTPMAIIQFVRFGSETSWFSSEYLCQRFYNASCQVINFSSDCAEKKYPCFYTTGARTLSIVSVVLYLTMFAVYFAMILFARRQLRGLPYQEHRISYVELGFQLQTRLIACVLYIFSLIIFTAVRPSACGSLILTTMGDAPMQIVYATVVLFQVVVSTPAIQFRASKIKLHAWLQDFAWLERDVEAKLAARPFEGEPCFCFETSLKMFYYCNLIYDLDDVPDSPYTLDVALRLYNLTHYRILFHEKQDAKCLAAWNPETRTIVFSFRGTASMANVRADIKVWRRPHPPERGHYWFFTQPMVHVGFLETWEDSGMKAEVLELLDNIMNGGDGGGITIAVKSVDTPADASAASSSENKPPLPRKKANVANKENQKASRSSPEAPWRVFATGHSLGGALAHLCSHDICIAVGDRVKLTCTTFGAPRPGNHSFARSFQRTVPDAWDIFHPDDAVARAGKFFVLYKRAAHTVIVSATGELVVRPSYAEQSVRRGFSPRLTEHLLSRYANSLGAILKTAIDQGDRKHTPNEPLPIIQSEALGDGDGGYAEATEQSTYEALRELLARDYIQDWLSFTNAIRQDSLLRIMGATSSRIEQARLQIVEDDEAAHEAQRTRKGLNCGTCMTEGVVLNCLNDPKSLLRWRDKDAAGLHVQD